MMKRLICIFLIHLCIHNLGAQKQFEGIVEYELHNANKTDAQLFVFFGKSKVKTVLQESNDTTSSKIIIDLDSGWSFCLNEKDKTFTAKTLYRSLIKTNPALLSIAGYRTSVVTPIGLGTSESDDYLRFYFSRSKFYVADDLYYLIPENLADNVELMMINNGKIVLGAEFFIEDDYEKTDSINPTLTIPFTSISAKMVNAVDLDDSLFQIPVGYRQVKKQKQDSGIENNDSVAVQIEPPSKLNKTINPKQNSSPQRTKPSPIKSPALRRKQR